MIDLESTDKIQVVLAAAIATTQPDCIAEWSDQTQDPSYVIGRSAVATNGTTAVDWVTSPAGGVKRKVSALTIYNRDSASITATISLLISSTAYFVWKGTLAASESLRISNAGVQVLSSSGRPPVGSGGGGGGAWGAIAGTLSDQTDLQAELDGKQPVNAVLTATTASFTTAKDSKLSGIAAGATANSPDATLLARANHTGSQTASTISDFDSSADARAAVGIASHIAAGDPHTQYALESTIGAANGIASLDSSGLVPSSQLPSFVDDVLEFASLAGFPGSGASGKIYVAIDTGKTYRWSGSAYVEISASPGSTDSVTEGSSNLYFTNARARSAISVTQNLAYNSGTGLITGPDLTSFLTSSVAASTYQPIDGDLTAIAALAGTSGLARKTAANTWSLDATAYLATSSDVQNSFGTPTNNLFFATPNGSAGAPTLRSIAVSDIPTLNQNTTGSAAKWTTGRTIALTGNVTGTSIAFDGSANLSFATTIPAATVTLSMQANLAANSIIGNNTGSAATPLALTAAQVKTMLAIASGDVSGLGTLATQSGTFSGTSSGANTGDQNLFSTIAVSGQSNIVADAASDTLTLVAGANVTITTDAATDTITIAAAGGGSGSPGGANTQIQFNDAGAFGGDADLAWDKTTNTMALGGTDTGIAMTGITTEPAAPASTVGRWYTKSVAGRVMPKFIDAGYDYMLSPHFGFNNVRIWRGGATTTATTFASTIGTMPYTGASPTAPTIPTLASTSVLTQTSRSTISTGATAGALAYIRSTQTQVWRGNAAGLGGFFVVQRFALSALQAGMRAFAGLVDVAANPTNIDPTTTTTPGGVGLAINANTGNWKLVNNVTGAARTSADLGANFPVNTTDLLELVLYSKPNDSGITYRVTNLTTGNTTTGTLTTNIPANTTFLAPSAWITNNATAAAATMDFVSTFIETDF